MDVGSASGIYALSQGGSGGNGGNAKGLGGSGGDGGPGGCGGTVTVVAEQGSDLNTTGQSASGILAVGIGGNGGNGGSGEGLFYGGGGAPVPRERGARSALPIRAASAPMESIPTASLPRAWEGMPETAVGYGAYGYGGGASSGGNGGEVDVTNSGTITVGSGSVDIFADAIFAQSVGGNGGNAGSSGGVGSVGGSGGGGGYGGNVTVTNSGVLQASGNDDGGIYVQSIGGGGGNDGSSSGFVTSVAAVQTPVTAGTLSSITITAAVSPLPVMIPTLSSPGMGGGSGGSSSGMFSAGG